MILGGCASTRSLSPVQPSLEQLSTSKSREAVTAVNVTRACEKLTKRVKPPKDWVGKNAFQSRKEALAALELANTKLDKAGACIDRTSSEYSVGLRKK